MPSNSVTAVFVGLTIALTVTCCTLLILFLPSSEKTSSSSSWSFSKCVPRAYSFDSVVCVCNASYCDDIEGPFTPSAGLVLVYTSTRDGKRFSREELIIEIEASIDSDFNFSVNPNRHFQKIKGFGGAFTDAAGINIHNLSSGAQENLLRSYFSPKGIEYNIGRIPMASCDFSTRLYTYADSPGDFELKNFSLAMEDFNYKIPYMQRAKQLSNRSISFFGSPWSAPAWMKTNNNLFGKGSLIGEAGNKYHQTWALYFARFMEAYAENGIDIWGVTAQNEPNAGLVDFPFQCMGFTAEQQRDFVKTDLGPVLEQRGHGHVKIMVGDDQRIELPEWAKTVLSDPEAAKYASGVGVHWYTDWLSDPIRLSRTHELFPNHFILATEACAGSMPWHNDVQLGNWVRGERYSIDILQDMNNWAVGWVDWNMALNLQGGPNWVENFVDSPIVVNAERDEFYKQPTYYHLGHFSKFLPEGSTRIEVTGPDQQTTALKYAGFLQPDGRTICVVILNKDDDSFTANIAITEKQFLRVTIPKKSIQSFLWTLS